MSDTDTPAADVEPTPPAETPDSTPEDFDHEQFPADHPLVVAFGSLKSRLQQRTAERDTAVTERDGIKAEGQGLAERLAAAEAEAAAVPAKVATALRGYLIDMEGIDQADADLFLTATDPDLLLKQFGRWVEQTGKRANYVPREGQSTPPGSSDATREFIRAINGRE